MKDKYSLIDKLGCVEQENDQNDRWGKYNLVLFRMNKGSELTTWPFLFLSFYRTNHNYLQERCLKYPINLGAHSLTIDRAHYNYVKALSAIRADGSLCMHYAHLMAFYFVALVYR